MSDIVLTTYFCSRELYIYHFCASSAEGMSEASAALAMFCLITSTLLRHRVRRASPGCEVGLLVKVSKAESRVNIYSCLSNSNDIASVDKQRQQARHDLQAGFRNLRQNTLQHAP